MLEALVAGEMPKRIVVGLEVVDIDECDGDVLAGLCSFDDGCDLTLERAAVADPGQRVAERQL